ncbi:3-oxoacyl-ACP synthase III family protein [Sphingobium sp. AS12]|uniref:3-oxoacyl-ACP synthase III family protein n=1 Tax=Sphingobium sp. AS12 TaxID=2849495 RepID=UPI0034A53115
MAVLGAGMALPGLPISTETLLDMAGLEGKQRSLAIAVAKRLGVRTRHVGRSWRARADILRQGCSNADLAADAMRAALRDAGFGAGDLGYLIAHTATPAQPLPSNAALVADRLGYSGPHVELRQACTGFANALMIAFGLLKEPDARPVAIVGSETGSVFLDVDALDDAQGQLVNLVQMGDGAGAIILGPAAARQEYIHAAWFGAMGLGRHPGLQMRHGGSDRPALLGAGPLVFEHDFAAIGRSGAALFEAGAAVAEANGAALAHVDHIIPHQASGRIGLQLASYFGLPDSRFFVNADRIGNTGSAAIWIALAELRAQGHARGSRTLVLGAEATKYMHGGFVHVVP